MSTYRYALPVDHPEQRDIHNAQKHEDVAEIRERRQTEQIPLFACPVVIGPTGFHYHHHEDATNSELFFDLFFIANLSNLTSNNKINDVASLTQYIGWFSIIWTTWLQVTLFDARFSVDSVFTRCSKLLQCCVQLALAAESGNFSTREAHERNTFTIKSLLATNTILLISRVVLTVDYMVPLYFLWNKKQRVTLPLILCSLIFLTSICVYGGLCNTFTGDNAVKYSYRAWYVIAAFELVSMIAVSCVWRVLSFKDTHLVKRMGLLTLIILAEGVLNVATTIGRIQRSRGWDGIIFGETLAFVIIVYMLWVLYSDKSTKEEHFGTIKQQVFALLHYPYHLALSLLLEGVKLWVLIGWANIQAQLLISNVVKVLDNDKQPHAQAQHFNNTALSILNQSGFFNATQMIAFGSSIDPVVFALAANNSSAVISGLNILGEVIVNSLFEAFQLQASTAYIQAIDQSDISDPTDVGDLTFDAFNNLFGIAYAYFLTTAGAVLILLAVFRWLVLVKKDRLDYLCIATRVILGVFLCCLNFFLLSPADIAINFALSHWLLPTFMLTLLTIALGDSVFDAIGLRRSIAHANSRVTCRKAITPTEAQPESSLRAGTASQDGSFGGEESRRHSFTYKPPGDLKEETTIQDPPDVIPPNARHSHQTFRERHDVSPHRRRPPNIDDRESHGGKV